MQLYSKLQAINLDINCSTNLFTNCIAVQTAHSKSLENTDHVTTKAQDTALSSGTPCTPLSTISISISMTKTISISMSKTMSNQHRQLLEASSQTSPKTLKYKILNINPKGGWEGPKTSSSGSHN